MSGDQMEKVRKKLLDWARAAKWMDDDLEKSPFQDGNVGTILALIDFMKHAHSDERSYADLQASGGLHPEFYADVEQKVEERIKGIHETCLAHRAEATRIADSYIHANARFRSVSHRIANKLEQMVVELRDATTITREA